MAGYGFNATQMDVAMVNGGLQPIIKMAPNVPQRWRIFNANWKVCPRLQCLAVPGSCRTTSSRM